MDMSPTVVRVCLHGSAKSLIAAEHCQKLATRRGLDLRATAAGLEPNEKVPSPVVEGLLRDRIDVRGGQPRRISREDLAGAWRVVSFGCDVGGMVSPGVAVKRWDDIPAVSEHFDVARDEIVARVARPVGAWEGHPRP
jgi:arsenate reductase (thioredoxin)